MRWFRLSVSFLLVVFLFLPLNAGCTHSRPYPTRYLEAPRGQVFLSPAPNFGDPRFLSKWASPQEERDKIRYLLERIGESKNRFTRNGRSHGGQKARRWLLYKLSRWVSGVETAEDFVSRVASFSKRTGKPYLVESPEGKPYSLRSVLRNELSAFETYLATFNPLSHAGGLSNRDPVSLSQTVAPAPTT